MRVLLSTYASGGDVKPIRAEGCDSLVATGVTPAGVWR
jgi:hypothetical protein